MRNRSLIISMSLLLAFLLLSGCGDSEKKARASFNKAQVLIRNGDVDEGKKLLDEVISKYPETTVATEANKVLNAMEAIGAVTKILQEETVANYNLVVQADLRNAAIAQESYYIDNATYSNSIDKLINSEYGLYLAEGVSISVIAADDTKYVMKASHIKGGKTYIISGPGGSVHEE